MAKKKRVNHKTAASRKARRGHNAVFGSRKRAGMAGRKGQRAKLHYKMASSAKRKADRFALNPAVVSTKLKRVTKSTGWLRADAVRFVKKRGRMEVFIKRGKARRKKAK